MICAEIVNYSQFVLEAVVGIGIKIGMKMVLLIYVQCIKVKNY